MILKFLADNKSTQYWGRYKWKIRQSVFAWLPRIHKWRQNATTRKELANLPSYLYQDIGLTDRQVHHEIQKKFWQ